MCREVCVCVRVMGAYTQGRWQCVMVVVCCGALGVGQRGGASGRWSLGYNAASTITVVHS